MLACGNKSELAVGYSTIYGDAVGGYAPLKDVPKTMVWELARWRNALARTRGEEPPIPENAIAKPPSAELRPDQLDTDSLPDYALLDDILDDYVERDASSLDLVATGLRPRAGRARDPPGRPGGVQAAAVPARSQDQHPQLRPRPPAADHQRLARAPPLSSRLRDRGVTQATRPDVAAGTGACQAGPRPGTPASEPRDPEVPMTDTTPAEEPAPYGGAASTTAAAAAPAPAPTGPRRIRVHHLHEMKARGERWAMLTAYDQYAAATFDEAGIPVLLVGDSASNNVYGNETSLAGHGRRAGPACPCRHPIGAAGAGGGRPAVRVLPALAGAGLRHRGAVHEGVGRARGQARGRAGDGAAGGACWRAPASR